MHETGLVRALIRQIDQVAAANGATRVAGVAVRLGALSHLSAAHFREHFEAESCGSTAEGASLTITESVDPADPDAQHLRLESVELEV
ncbi:MAG: hydrogenase/urease maturation nickel metallochaperone HypA [Acetobacteraceae bacterium]